MRQGSPSHLRGPRVLTESWGIFLAASLLTLHDCKVEGCWRGNYSCPFQSIGVDVNRGSRLAPMWRSYCPTVVLSFVLVPLSERNHPAPP